MITMCRTTPRKMKGRRKQPGWTSRQGAGINVQRTRVPPAKVQMVPMAEDQMMSTAAVSGARKEFLSK